ncbi:hypothetical protein, partial [Klebsiella grimontii]|uniref:hypothetical protein n=1 Tax=Klebsiella grimontii TaxID=2058152 RepID=UPI001C49B237
SFNTALTRSTRHFSNHLPSSLSSLPKITLATTVATTARKIATATVMAINNHLYAQLSGFSVFFDL